MDAVKAFNAELSALYEVKPPISKAKMTSITRGAIKAIKFYKHVVQSVEKFILKCKPEYKVPGLYVIDSIVRQSRHQFGADKDVFAPRFSKNMQQTFLNLFKCPPEDKSKIIRVLNLWQKNQVFPPDAIQPLFDLADPNHPIHKELNAAAAVAAAAAAAAQSNGLGNSNVTNNIAKGSPALQKTPTKVPQQGASDTSNVSQHGNNTPATLDQNTLAQLQQLHKLLIRQGGDSVTKPEGQPVHFDRKLLDFDYGSDEEEDPSNSSPKYVNPPNPAFTAIESVGSLLTNPEVLRQLQTLQNSILQQGTHSEVDLEKLRKLQEMKQQEEEFDKHLAQTVPNLPFAAECEFKPNTNSPAILPGYFLPVGADLSQPPPGYKTSYDTQPPTEEGTMESEVEFVSGNDNDVEVITLDHGDSRSPSPRDDRYNRRRRSRSRERSRERARERRSRRSSRSRSRSRSRRHRTRSRERDREKEKEREKEREKDKERKKRGLPPVKKDHLSVCSTTLWVGHLSKLVHQEDLSDTFGEFGEIISIDLIIPRGCAFIVMDRRQDAARCLAKLKSHKLHGKALTLAWAPGKGVKGKDLKDYWEGDLGVSYIPFAKLKPDVECEMLEDGGTIDEETMPPWLKAKASLAAQKAAPISELIEINVPPPIISTAPASTVDTSQPPPIPPGGGLLQPPPLTLPLVPPYQLNRGLLSMNLPPGNGWPNVPIGVPPPSLPGPLMPNQLLGIGSPFGQAPPSLIPPQSLPQIPLPGSDKDNSSDGSMPPPNIRTPLLGLPQSFTMIPPQLPVTVPVQHGPPHDETMDVEMEDAAEKGDRHPPALSDQLLASLNSYNSETNLSAAVNRLHAVVNHRPNPGGLGSDSQDGDDRRDRRGDDRDRNRSRDRDRDRNRGDRGGRNSNDRNKDNRERDNSRGDRNDNRRDRGNRWGERDQRDRERDERRDREKALNDRLREMANDGGSYASRDRNDEPEGRPPLLDRPMFPPPPFNSMGDLDMECPPPDIQRMDREHDDRFRRGPFDDRHRGPDDRRGPLEDRRGPLDRHDRHGPPMDERRRGPPIDDRCGPPDNFDHRMRGPPPDNFPPPLMDIPEFDQSMEGLPEFEGPPEFVGPPEFEGPPQFDGPPPMLHEPIMEERFPRRDNRFGGDDRHMVDDFDPMMRGPPPGPRPDFFPPRDNFGPPRGPPMMRGARSDGFTPRGMRQPMFHPRGPHMHNNMRGPRPGPPWMDGGGMRSNFTPRFEGPRGFRGPPPHFDDNPRHRRFEDRRRFEEPDHGHEEFGELIEQNERPERRSRWGNSSPVEEGRQFDYQPGPGSIENEEFDESQMQETFPDQEETVGNENVEEDANGFSENPVVEEVREEGSEQIGNTTPLRDEVGGENHEIKDNAEVDDSEKGENEQQEVVQEKEEA